MKVKLAKAILDNAGTVAEVLTIKYRDLIIESDTWVELYFDEEVPDVETAAADILDTEKGFCTDVESLDDLKSLAIEFHRLQKFMEDSGLPPFDVPHSMEIALKVSEGD